MTLTLEKDLEQELEQYPEVLENLPTLIREQIALEKWRQKRYAKSNRDRAKQLLKEAQETSISREEASKNLDASIEKIAPYFNPDHD